MVAQGKINEIIDANEWSEAYEVMDTEQRLTSACKLATLMMLRRHLIAYTDSSVVQIVSSYRHEALYPFRRCSTCSRHALSKQAKIRNWN